MSAEGFRLVIPQEMLNRLQTADEKLEQLGKTSEKTQQRVIASFSAMTDGINPFIQKLNEAQQALANIGNHKGGNINLGNVSIQATQAADDVNKLVDVIAKLYAENEKIKNQQLSTRGITIAQEGQLSKKQASTRAKELLNDERELMNAQRERERELMRADKESAKRHALQMARYRQEIQEITRFSRIYAQIPKTLSTKDAGRLIARSVQSDKSINQSLIAIKNLEKAKKDLDTTDRRYAQTLAKINSEIDRHKANLRKLGVETENVRKHQSNLMNHAQQLRRALALVFSVSQITGYVNKMIQVRGEFELQQRSLQAILQNKDEANRIWQQTVDLAVRSPFRVKELVTYTKQLAAYRVETDKLHEPTRMLSDVSAGLGVDMQRLILAFGQVKAANYLRGTELRQFSEAGINILGELSKYFTELEGRAISVGEVFERVSKRMVSFSDVEEIFKRITSEGGIFYRMQEIQSETVKGLISNLYDQIDLMFNDIGKSNEGVLKGSIGLVKEFVESWREVAWYLEKAAYSFVTYTAVTKLAKLGTSGFTQALFSLGQGAGGAAKVVAFLGNVLRGLGAATIVGAIVAIGFAIFELWRRTTKARREAERLQKELRDIYNTDYSAFKQQTKTFEDLVGRLQSVNKGSQEHRDIIGKINSQYGEYLGYIVTETTSYDKLYLSINKVNDAILRKAKSATFEKAFSKSFEDTTKRIASYQEDLKKRIENATVGKRDKDGIFYNIIPTEDELNDIFSIFEKRVKETGENISQWSELQKIFEQYGLKLGTPMFWDSSEFVGYSQTILEQKEAELKLEQQINGIYNDTNAKTLAHRQALEEVNKREKERLETLEKQGNTSTYNYKKEVDRIKKEAQIERIKLQVQYEGLDKSVADKRIAELNTLSATIIDVNNKIEKSVGKLGEKYASIIYIDEAEAATGVSQIAENTAQAYKAQQEIIKQQNALKSAGTVYDAEVLDNAQKTAKAYYYKLELLGRLDLLQKEQNKKESKELQLLNKQLAALKEAKQTFDNLRQKFGLEESTKRTAKAFKDLFAELDMTQFTLDMTFDNQGIIDVIEEIPNKAGKAGQQAIEKVEAELQGGLDVDTKVGEDKTLVKQIEDMFSGYELSLELQKLNVPPDLAKQLFNVDTLTLPQLKDQLKGMKSLFVGTDMEGKYREALRKVEEMERTAQEERLKTYSKYLIKGMDERVRIKIEELRKLEEVEKDKEKYTSQQLADIRKAIQEETKEALDKQAWEEFKKSDIYISLFEDLEKASDKSLEFMVESLTELRESLNNLQPEQLKEVVSQLEKAKKVLDERSPFQKFGNDLKDYFGNIGKRKEAQQGADDTKKRLTYLRAESKRLSEIITQYESRIEKGEKLTKKEKDHLGMVKTGLSITKSEISNAEKAQQEWLEILDSIDATRLSMGNQISSWGDNIGKIAGDIGSLTTALENGIGLSDSMADALGMVEGTMSGLSDIAAGIAGFIIGGPMGIIGGAMSIIGGISNIIGSINKIADKGKERRIEREIALLKRLQRVYEELGETIEDTYRIDTLNEATKLSQDNLKAQIAATERMIQAEEDKKETDHARIEDWKNDIEDMREALIELEETRIEELGGFGSDANKKSGAQAFIDAWMEAYKETGDGLSGLNKQFDEFFEDMVKKQMVQRAANQFLTPFYEEYDKIVDKWGLGELSAKDAIDAINKLQTQYLPGFNENMKDLAEQMGVDTQYAGSEANLSGLAAGVQGITEATAEVLASYMNSVRFYVADNNEKFTNLVTRLFDSEGGSNPMLVELRAQTAFLREIRDSFDAVIGRGGNTHTGAYLKVAIG